MDDANVTHFTFRTTPMECLKQKGKKKGKKRGKEIGKKKRKAKLTIIHSFHLSI